MNEPESNSPNNGKSIPPPLPLISQQYHASEYEYQGERVDTAVTDKPIKRIWKYVCRTAKRKWIELREAGADRQIELILATSIFFLAIIQWNTVRSNNKSTAEQTSQLIAAAQISAYAAKDNVEASRNFADSAKSINQGISDAVGKLSLQAQRIEDSRQSSIVNSQKSLDATIAISRQDQRAWVNIFGISSPTFRVGNSTSFVYLSEGQPFRFAIIVKNSGKSPAVDVVHKAQTATGPVLEYVPPPDDRESKEGISRGEIAPDGTMLISLTYPHPITAGLIKSIESGEQTIYAVGKIYYFDVSRKIHYTSFCAEMDKSLNTFNPCPNYNTTDD
jgi:hypothetical protein